MCVWLFCDVCTDTFISFNQKTNDDLTHFSFIHKICDAVFFLLVVCVWFTHIYSEYCFAWVRMYKIEFYS